MHVHILVSQKCMISRARVVSSDVLCYDADVLVCLLAEGVMHSR